MDHAFGSTPSAWQHVPEDAFVKVVPGEKWPDGGGHMTQNSNGESDTPLPDDVWDAAFDPDPSNAWVSESSYGRNGIFLQQVRTFYDEELNGEEGGGYPTVSAPAVILTLPDDIEPPAEDMPNGNITLGADGVIRLTEGELSDSGLYLGWTWEDSNYDNLPPEVPWEDTDALRWRFAGDRVELDGCLVGKEWVEADLMEVVTPPELAWHTREQPYRFLLGYLNVYKNGLVTAIPLGDAAPTPCVFFDGYSYPLNQFNAEAQ